MYGIGLQNQNVGNFGQDELKFSTIFNDLLGLCHCTTERRKKILPILWIVNAIIIINGRFLFNDLTSCTRTSHGWTEEDINEQHDGEKDSKSNTKPH